MEIDPRGPRFSAVLTLIVLAVVLITRSTWLLAFQVAVFGIGALAGLRYAPYGLVYRYLVRPRLGSPAYTEAEAPPRFAQAVGAVFTVGALAGFLAGSAAVGIVLTALAFVAAFLNAAFNFCLGCQVYLFIQRSRLSAIARGRS